MSGTLAGAIAFLSISVLSLVLPLLVTHTGRLVGWHLRRKTAFRRTLLLERSHKERAEHLATFTQPQKERPSLSPTNIPQSTPNKDWCGIIGFFHPFW